MRIAKSLRRKIVATLAVVAGFVVFYQATIFDSRFSTRQVLRGTEPGAADTGTSAEAAAVPTGTVATAPRAAQPATRAAVERWLPPDWITSPPPTLRFVASAYCRGVTTASGVIARTGVAAADEDLLPVGSVIQVGSLGPRYDGVYTIMDTGPKVVGRKIDVYVRNCDEAVRFGRRAITVVVLRLGWNPRDTEPTLFDRLLDWGNKAAERALPGRLR